MQKEVEQLEIKLKINFKTYFQNEIYLTDHYLSLIQQFLLLK